MQLTPEQVKGRIKNVAKENKADARTLMRIYMMERFLERVASSQYKVFAICDYYMQDRVKKHSRFH